MARQSAQHKLDRVRPPRVQITYDVEVGGAIEIKELPFVVGVLGDFTGNPEQPLAETEGSQVRRSESRQLRHRAGGNEAASFLRRGKQAERRPRRPEIEGRPEVPKLDDFEPGNVAKQVKPLKELLDLRSRLADLRGSLQGNDKLEELLLEAVGNTEKLEKLKGEIGAKDGGSNG